ncbi:MAG: hypothetical protein ACOH5I_11870 [Oligoflexus sp.]
MAAENSENLNTTVTSQGGQDTVWSIGFQTSQLALKSGDGDHLLGLSTAVQLGRGWIGDNWFASVSLDIISGPFQSPKQQELVVDFSGTGGTAVLAYSTENQSLRTYAGNYGFLLGLSYQDVVGRSVGRRSFQTQGVAVDNWVMRVNNFSVFPAIFFCWLKPEPKSKGNDPQSLMTRIEGYFLTIGISTPLQATYSLSYDENNLPQSSRGDLQGYTLIVSLSTLLGV